MRTKGLYPGASIGDDYFTMVPTRKEAWQLVCEYTESESLRRNMLSVESAMRAYVSRFGDDADLWGVVGLLHDFDYERYPDVSDDNTVATHLHRIAQEAVTNAVKRGGAKKIVIHLAELEDKCTLTAHGYQRTGRSNWPVRRAAILKSRKRIWPIEA